MSPPVSPLPGGRVFAPGSSIAGRRPAAGPPKRRGEARPACPAPAPQGRPSLRPDQVEYLVFEGGGGKGFAYMGALQALEELGVLVQERSLERPRGMQGQPVARVAGKLRGFGGASAGAITAFLLSIGMNSTELAKFMAAPFTGGPDALYGPGTLTPPARNDLTAFYDGGPPHRARLEVGGACTPITDLSDDERRMLRWLRGVQRLGGAGPLELPTSAPLGLLAALVGLRVMGSDVAKEPPLQQILPYWPEYLVALLGRDMGLFAGCSARNLFATMLAERMPPGADGNPQFDATFRQHCEHFGVELLVTGSELTTGQSRVFSASETPDFAVADAVRISMGFPFAFKPVIIGEGAYEGVWIDGGVWNNLPFRAFEDRSGDDPTTLCLRLDIPGRATIDHGRDFIARFLEAALTGAGEAQVTSARRFQTIELDTEGLSTLNFAPPLAAQRVATDRAFRATLDYFAKPGAYFPPTPEP